MWAVHPAPAIFANRYALQSRLGVGTQGEVYAAFDQNEQVMVALKLLGPSSNPLGPWVEGAILRNLSDHHILPIHNADVHLGQRYLVTALATGGSVDNLISRAAHCGLSIDDTVAWIRQACHGVARGNDAGLLHNDIKPGNLFLNENNECVVADWGYASKINPHTGLARPAGGTAHTVAPEIAQAWGTTASPASIRSDVYSLGATAYWMLAATPPFDLSACADVPSMMQVVATTTPKRLFDVAPHVPRWVSDRIEKAMARDPAARYANAHLFAADLGHRPAVQRRWERTDEHGTHLACWRGHPTGTGATYVTCMAASSSSSRVDFVTTYAKSGRRVTAGCCTATKGSWARTMRRIVRDLP